MFDTTLRIVGRLDEIAHMQGRGDRRIAAKARRSARPSALLLPYHQRSKPGEPHRTKLWLWPQHIFGDAEVPAPA